MNKRTVYFLGSSHAQKLAIKAQENKEFVTRFNIKQYTKPGANFSQLPCRPVPESIKSDDLLIVQCFGNNLMRRPKYQRDRPKVPFLKHNGRKILVKKIHLDVFEPISQKAILDEYVIAKSYFENISCPIWIVDNPIRHTKCCEEHAESHRKKGLFKFQTRQNKILAKFFKKVRNVSVFDHRLLLGLDREFVRGRGYERLLPDSVHLSSELYGNIVQNLLIRAGTYSPRPRTPLRRRKDRIKRKCKRKLRKNPQHGDSVNGEAPVQCGGSVSITQIAPPDD